MEVFVLFTIAVIIVLLIIGNIFTYPLQDYFIFRPKKLPGKHTFQFERPYEEQEIRSTHQGRLNALWFKKDPRRKSEKGLILFFHGNASNLARWGHLYHYFFKFGYDYFVYDYRGYGKSRGRRNERIMYEDAEAIYEFVKEHYPVNKIIIYGRSIGCSFATYLATKAEPPLVVLETPFSNIRDLFYTYFPFLPRLFLFKYNLRNHHFIQQVKAPVYIFQGTHDLIVPYKCAAKLIPYLKAEDAFYTIPGGRHNDLIFYDIYDRKMKEILG